jgi:hypothetical protein
MTIFRVALAIAALLGLASGWSALGVAAASQPPLMWRDLLLMLIGCAVALPVVLGLQAALGTKKAVCIGWYLFLLAGVNFFATGVSATLIAMSQSALAPHSFLFLVIGTGALLGVAGSRILFGGSLAKAWPGRNRATPDVRRYAESVVLRASTT